MSLGQKIKNEVMALSNKEEEVFYKQELTA